MATTTVSPKIVFAAILLAVILILIVQNTETVGLRVLFWEASFSKVLLILLTTGIGFAAGFLVAKVTGRTRRSGGAGTV